MTKIAAILNITPDSFSGDGLMDAETACAHIAELFSTEVDIVDIGAESTRPGAKSLSAEEEWDRLAPVLTSAYRCGLHACGMLSIDSYHPENAARAMALGVRMVNDVSGLTNPGMLALAARSKAYFVAMHALSVPANPQQVIEENSDVIQVIRDWHRDVLKRMHAHGIAEERVYFDPGIGFGKTAEQSLRLLTHMADYAKPSQRWYIGHSRKSFLKCFGAESVAQRDGLTAVFSGMLMHRDVGVIRVHDVARHMRIKKAMCHGI